MTESTAKDIVRLPEALKIKAQLVPDRVAHDNTFRVLTLAEWDREADEVAGGLAAAGLREGDRVILPITNDKACEMAIAVIAVMRCGAIAAPVNTRLSPEEVKEYLALIEPRFAITDVPDLLKDVQLEQVWSADAMPSDLAALPDQSKFTADADAVIMGTSGTTGKIKGVVTSHSNLVAGMGDGTRVDKYNNATLHALPFTSSGGMLGECLLPLTAAQTCFTLPKFDAGKFLHLVAEKKPTVLYFVPTMLRLILDHPDVAKYDFSSVRFILTGTAPLQHDSVMRAFALWPHVMLRNSYGMSEGGIGTSTTTREQVLKPGCVGPLPPHMEIRHEDGNRIDEPNVVGEIYGKSGKPKRYWRDDSGSAKGWVGGWTKTGDLGYVDEDGDLILSGRSKELIIRGGYNITPLEIENVLHDHPAVKDAAVVGVNHEVLGEDVAAAIVLLTGASATEQELTDWCKARLADNKVPRTIVFVDEMPLNASAKIVKRELQPLLQRAADEKRAARQQGN